MALALKYSDIRRAVARYLGLDTDATTWTAAQTQDVSDILDAGVRRFLWPVVDGELLHNWSFLRRTVTIPLVTADWDYDLPADFVSLIDDPMIQVDGAGRLDEAEEVEILSMQAKRTKSGRPVSYAIRTKEWDAAAGTQYEMIVYPTPWEAENVLCVYEFDPGPIVWDQYPIGGTLHAETVLEACLASAELTLGRTVEMHAKRFQERLLASIAADRRQRA